MLSGDKGQVQVVFDGMVDSSITPALGDIDGDGALAAFVVNQASRDYMTAVRGGGAYRNGQRVQPSARTRVEDAVVGLAGLPARILPSRTGTVPRVVEPGTMSARERAWISRNAGASRGSSGCAAAGQHCRRRLREVAKALQSVGRLGRGRASSLRRAHATPSGRLD